jgi:5'-3' exonuclease
VNNVDFFLDTSYFLYYTIFGAYSKFCKGRDVEKGNDVDLTQDSDFIDTLNIKFTQNLKYLIESVIYPVFEDIGIDPEFVEKQKVIAAIDCAKNSIWRTKLHNSYKLQRRVEQKRDFNVGKVFGYIWSTLLASEYITNKCGSFIDLVPIRVQECEGDDIIATLFKNSKAEYRVIIASDHDFVQLLENEKTILVNLTGNRITLNELHEGKLDTKEKYLLYKILFGDPADNIPHVLPGYGGKKCIKMANDPKSILKLLKENEEAAKQFKINSTLIDMCKIPEEIQQRINRCSV